MIVLKQQISYTTFLYLIAFFLPISQKASTICIGVLLLASIFNAVKIKPYLNLNLTFPALLYLIYCISLLYSTESQFIHVEQKASLFLFPAIFTLVKFTKVEFKSALKFFVLGCLTSLIICELFALYNSFDTTSLTFNSKTDDSVSFYNSLAEDKNLFFSYNFSFLHQTVYYAMYLVFAIVIMIHLKVFKNKQFQNLVIFFMILGVFQILNKASFLALFSISLWYCFLFIKNKKKALITLIVLLITAITLFLINPRFQNFNKKIVVIDETSVLEKDFKKIKNTSPRNHNFRVMLWQSSIEIILQNPIIGIGAGGSDKRLYEVFAVKRQWYDKAERHNVHNQYLQILLDIGLVGFFFFVLCFFTFFKSLSGLKDTQLKFISTGFIIILLINFIFESVFERYSGISFFCFFFCGILSFYRKTYFKTPLNFFR